MVGIFNIPEKSWLQKCIKIMNSMIMEYEEDPIKKKKYTRKMDRIDRLELYVKDTYLNSAFVKTLGIVMFGRWKQFVPKLRQIHA
jgi:hypothetical protein